MEELLVQQVVNIVTDFQVAIRYQMLDWKKGCNGLTLVSIALPFVCNHYVTIHVRALRYFGLSNLSTVFTIVWIHLHDKVCDATVSVLLSQPKYW